MTLLRGWSLGAIASLIACGPSSLSDETVSVRDSAGVHIVQHEQIPDALPVWEITAAPELRIGALGGPGPDVFGAISGLAERADGVIVVADRDAAELRAFDRSGNHRWTAGGRGEGPGEFMSLAGVVTLAGDSVLAWDFRSGRASVFDPDGAYVRSFRPSEPEPVEVPPGVMGVPRPMSVLGRLSDGTLVTTPGAPIPTPLTPGQAGRDSFLVAYHGSDGELRDAVGRFPLRERVAVEDRPQIVEMGASTAVAVEGEVLAVTVQDRFEILLYGHDASLGSVIRVDQERIPPDADAFRRLGRTGPLPEFLPALGELRVDADGSIWAEEFVPPYEERVPTWWVFEADGSLVARAVLPADFTPHTIGSEYVLGLRSDEFGVRYVELHEILR